MRRRWPFTARGTGALLLSVAGFAVAYETGIGELLYFAMILAAVPLGSLVALRLTRRAASVTRLLVPDVVAVGSEADVDVRLTVRTAIPTAPGTWEDTLPAGLAGRAHGAVPALGSGGEGVRLRYTVTGRARGIQPIGPLVVTITDPFGLARRRLVLGERTRVTVAPGIVALQTVPAGGGDGSGMPHAADARLGQGADNLIARPYAWGDSMRRIHWRATAHRDMLMVRQEERESSPEAVVVLDRGALRWSPEALHAPGLDDAFEGAVSLAVSAAARLAREGYAVALIDSDGTPLAATVGGGETGDPLTVAVELATTTTRRGDDLPALPHLFAGGVAGPVIVVTGRLDVADAEALAPLVAHSAYPVLVSADPHAGSLDRLRAAGWHAGTLRADLDRTWTEATERTATRAAR